MFLRRMSVNVPLAVINIIIRQRLGIVYPTLTIIKPS